MDEQWQSSLANAYAPGEFIDEDNIYKLLLANISSDEHVTPQSVKRYDLMNLVEKLNSLAEDTAPNVTNKVLYSKNIKLATTLKLHLTAISKNIKSNMATIAITTKPSAEFNEFRPTFEQFHNALEGHHGINKIIDIMRNASPTTIPNLKKLVKEAIARCVICQKLRGKPNISLDAR